MQTIPETSIPADISYDAAAERRRSQQRPGRSHACKTRHWLSMLQRVMRKLWMPRRPGDESSRDALAGFPLPPKSPAAPSPPSLYTPATSSSPLRPERAPLAPLDMPPPSSSCLHCTARAPVSSCSSATTTRCAFKNAPPRGNGLDNAVLVLRRSRFSGCARTVPAARCGIGASVGASINARTRLWWACGIAVLSWLRARFRTFWWVLRISKIDGNWHGNLCHPVHPARVSGR